jgi:hypothetical protein
MRGRTTTTTSRLRAVRTVLAMGLIPMGMALVAGCGRSDAAAAPAAPAAALERRFATPDGRAEVVMKVDRTDMTVADRVELVLRTTAQQPVQVMWPAVGEKLGDFTVASRIEDSPAAVERLPSGTAMTTEMRVYRLEPFLAGKHTIPALEFAVVGGGSASLRREGEGEKKEKDGGAASDGTVATLVSDPIEIEVRSLLGSDEKAELAPARGPLALPDGPGWSGWVVAGIVTLVIGAAAWAVVVMRHRRQPAAEAASPLEQVRARLRQLYQTDLATSADIRAAYTELAELLRRFASSAYGLPAADRTTEELLIALETVPLAPHRQIRELLTHMDEVRFAGADVAVQQARDTLDAASEIIAATGPSDAGGPA